MCEGRRARRKDARRRRRSLRITSTARRACLLPRKSIAAGQETPIWPRQTGSKKQLHRISCTPAHLSWPSSKPWCICDTLAGRGRARVSDTQYDCAYPHWLADEREARDAPRAGTLQASAAPHTPAQSRHHGADPKGHVEYSRAASRTLTASGLRFCGTSRGYRCIRPRSICRLADWAQTLLLFVEPTHRSGEIVMAERLRRRATGEITWPCQLANSVRCLGMAVFFAEMKARDS